MNLKSISEQYLNEVVVRVKPIHSGHVNDAYYLATRDRHLFLKVNREGGTADHFIREEEGLIALKEAFQSRVPEVVAVFEADEQQFIIMEYIETGSVNKSFWNGFGNKLAMMHRNTHTSFGWHHDNYIGNLPQNNQWTSSWTTFFAESRILPLVNMLVDREVFTGREIDQAEMLCREIENILPKEVPAFIHGDLWCGNFLVDKKAMPVLIDPSTSYSHREMDIGMTKLFGGFPPAFYEGYNEVFPLDNGWEDRLSLTQLYPLLVHATLFGGSYVARCKQTLGKFN